LFDKPLGSEDVLENLSDSNISASDLKKLRNKQRKAERKAALQASANDETKPQNVKNEEKDAASEPQVEKLIPKKLERPEDALAEALKFLTPLQLLVKDRIDTHLLAFEIYYRKGKMMLMLQSLKRAFRLDAKNAQLTRQLVLFKARFEELKPSLSATLVEVIQLELKKMIGDKVATAAQLHERFMQQHSGSLEHRVESAKAVAVLHADDDGKKRNAVNMLLSKNFDKLSNVSLELCREIIDMYTAGDRFGKPDETVLEELKAKCRGVYPLSSQFFAKDDNRLQQGVFIAGKEGFDQITEPVGEE